MGADELTLMELRVAEARRLMAEARALGEDAAQVEAVVIELELLLAAVRKENGRRPDRTEPAKGRR
jgi:hypothetical protein